jgi:hypothetical protein
VREYTRRVLSTPSLDGIAMLSTVVEVVKVQRDKETRCKTIMGADLHTLREAGGTWPEIADWTTMDERMVRSLARTSRPNSTPSPADEELASLTARVPDNPFFRICEMLAASRFFEAVANDLEDVTDWLCFELSTSGVDRTSIARHAQLGQLTLARRISRARKRA